MISMAEITDACDLFTDDTSLDAQLAPTRGALLPSERMPTRALGVAALSPPLTAPSPPCSMLDADAAIAVAADAESLSFEECARACGAGAFFDALRATGLLAELPALCADAPSSRHVPHGLRASCRGARGLRGGRPP